MQKSIKNTSSTVSLPASKVGSLQVGRAKISQPSRPPIPVQGQVLERVWPFAHLVLARKKTGRS